ncbi:MAG: HAMP domain-containing sensor histidine kinase [Gemmatimonadota bacterium]
MALDLVTELVHDIRSPLAAIMVLSAQLSRSGDVSDHHRRQLTMVYSAALGMEALMGDAMELATGGGQLSTEEPALFSVGEVIQWVADMVAPIAVGKGVELRTSFPDEELRWGHRAPLGRILLNLATNALHSTDEGHVEIIATPSAKGSVVPFAVRDTGRGIAPAALEALLQRVRLPEETGKYPRSGLGLPICRRLLRAMGSELEVESRPDCGTRFHFRLDLPLRGSFPGRLD